MKIAVEKPLADLTPRERVLLLDRRPTDAPALRERVAEIVERVRREGDAALRELARELDGVEPAELEVPRSRWIEALEALDPALRTDLEEAARNIEAFHRAQLPGDVEVEIRPGVCLARRWAPLGRVGVYAPGGRAAYPSSVLMGVLPARAAGVAEVVVCSPPGPDGLPPPAVRAAAAVAGADRLFGLGGAGAVAALALGTESVPRVDAVVGPGNRYVTEAKRQLAGEVVTDGPAGPSEVLVVAGPEADPRRCALELLAQAEHDPEAAVALVSSSERLLAGVRRCLAGEVERSPRRAIVEAALAARGALLRSRNLREALDFARAYAPEHLALYTSDPRRDVEAVPTAGTVFLGEASAVAFGDYLTGANHVLPTGGLARAFSGLSTLSFLRSYTVQELTSGAAAALAPAVERLARAEGLPGHGEAARARREDP